MQHRLFLLIFVPFLSNLTSAQRLRPDVVVFRGDATGSCVPASGGTAGRCTSLQECPALSNLGSVVTCASAGGQPRVCCPEISLGGTTGFIGLRNITGQFDPSDCDDLNQSCSGWGRRGECDRNPAYMFVNCPRTCRTCLPKRTADCFDRADTQKCHGFAYLGYCTSNPQYMNAFCARSCRLPQCTRPFCAGGNLRNPNFQCGRRPTANNIRGRKKRQSFIEGLLQTGREILTQARPIIESFVTNRPEVRPTINPEIFDPPFPTRPTIFPTRPTIRPTRPTIRPTIRPTRPTIRPTRPVTRPAPVQPLREGNVLSPFCLVEGLLNLFRELTALREENRDSGRPPSDRAIDLLAATNYCQYGFTSYGSTGQVPPLAVNIALRPDQGVARPPTAPSSYPGLVFPGVGIHAPTSPIKPGPSSQPVTPQGPFLVTQPANLQTDSIFSCGCSLITPQHLLTAAHCLQVRPTSVRLGEFDFSRTGETTAYDYPVLDVVLHEDFRESQGFAPYADIAIITLAQEVRYSQFVEPFCMPRQRLDYTGRECVTSGWGVTDPQIGRPSQLRIDRRLLVTSQRRCQSILEGLKNRDRALREIIDIIFSRGITNEIICAGFTDDTCPGDSGGPLVFQSRQRDEQIGVVSKGMTGGCRNPELPGIYVSVDHHIDWISRLVSLCTTTNQ